MTPAGALRYAVNCSLLFTELPLLERPAAARAAGFDAVEFWWPWPGDPVPDDRLVEAFVASVTDAGVRLVALNFFAGDLPGQDAGVLSLPGRAQLFRDNVDVAVGIGGRLGAVGFNALYGNRLADLDPRAQDDLAVANLALAARAAAGIGATVLVEPLSGRPDYPLRTAEDVLAVLDRVAARTGATDLGLLCDIHHLAVNGQDPAEVIDRHADRIRHVQVADVPGRGAPGTGSLDIAGSLDRLRACGYPGWVALEYQPGPSTTDSLRWLPAQDRGAGRTTDTIGARR